jgi:hypothetical protein
MISFPVVKMVGGAIMRAVRWRGESSTRVMGVAIVFYENGKVLPDIMLCHQNGKTLVTGNDGKVEIPDDWRNQRIGLYLPDGRHIKWERIPDKFNGPHHIFVTEQDCIKANLIELSKQWGGK